MSEHISKQFDHELETIRSQVMGMAGLVEEQVRLAMKALASGDAEVIQKVLEQERKVNELHVEIDDLCVHMIARRQPAASDLRMVMAVIKSVEDLERVGDKAESITRRAQKIYEAGRLQAPRFHELNHIANQALEMLAGSLDSFARMDAAKASEVRRADEQLNREYQGLQRQLITVMMEDPRAITATLDILWIAKAIERIGDLAVNVAEQVIYLVKGQDIRHKSQEEVEKVVQAQREG